MLKSAYEGLNARPKVYLSKEYFCEMYPTCVSSKLCEFICFINITFTAQLQYLHMSTVHGDDDDGAEADESVFSLT